MFMKFSENDFRGQETSTSDGSPLWNWTKLPSSVVCPSIPLQIRSFVGSFQAYTNDQNRLLF